MSTVTDAELQRLAQGAAKRAEATSLNRNKHSQFMGDFSAYELSVGRMRLALVASLTGFADLLPEQPTPSNASRLAKGLQRELNFTRDAHHEMRMLRSLFATKALLSLCRIDQRAFGREEIKADLLDAFVVNRRSSVNQAVASLVEALDSAAANFAKSLPRAADRPLTVWGEAKQVRKAQASLALLGVAFETDGHVNMRLQMLDDLLSDIEQSEGWKRSTRIISHQDEIADVSSRAETLDRLAATEHAFLEDWQTYLLTEDGRAVAALLKQSPGNVRAVVREVSRLDGKQFAHELGAQL